MRKKAVSRDAVGCFVEFGDVLGPKVCVRYLEMTNLGLLRGVLAIGNLGNWILELDVGKRMKSGALAQLYMGSKRRICLSAEIWTNEIGLQRNVPPRTDVST